MITLINPENEKSYIYKNKILMDELLAITSRFGGYLYCWVKNIKRTLSSTDGQYFSLKDGETYYLGLLPSKI